MCLANLNEKAALVRPGLAYPIDLKIDEPAIYKFFTLKNLQFLSTTPSSLLKPILVVPE